MKRIPFILTIVLMMSGATELRAEYAVVTVNTQSHQITISRTGADIRIAKLSEDDLINARNPAEGVEEVTDMEDEGWEICHTSSEVVGDNGMVYVFVLKRKNAKTD